MDLNQVTSLWWDKDVELNIANHGDLVKIHTIATAMLDDKDLQHSINIIALLIFFTHIPQCIVIYPRDLCIGSKLILRKDPDLGIYIVTVHFGIDVKVYHGDYFVITN